MVIILNLHYSPNSAGPTPAKTRDSVWERSLSSHILESAAEHQSCEQRTKLGTSACSSGRGGHTGVREDTLLLGVALLPLTLAGLSANCFPQVTPGCPLRRLHMKQMMILWNRSVCPEDTCEMSPDLKHGNPGSLSILKYCEPRETRLDRPRQASQVQHRRQDMGAEPHP